MRYNPRPVEGPSLVQENNSNSNKAANKNICTVLFSHTKTLSYSCTPDYLSHFAVVDSKGLKKVDIIISTLKMSQWSSQDLSPGVLLQNSTPCGILAIAPLSSGLGERVNSET